MKELTLTHGLEPIEFNALTEDLFHKSLIDTFKATATAYSSSNFPIMHRGFLDYAKLCYDNHYGIVISPDMIWNMVLLELSLVISADSEKYRNIFTESDDSILIKILSSDNLNPLELITALRSHIHDDVITNLIPTFTTTTVMSHIANSSAFLDAVSPYYRYGVFCCGIPKVKILGSDADWDILIQSAEYITSIIPELDDWMDRVKTVANKLKNPEPEMLKQFFSLNPVGSGGDILLCGWILDLFKDNSSNNNIDNYVQGISSFDYTNIDSGATYKFCSGLFSSKIDNGYLIPQFGSVTLAMK